MDINMPAVPLGILTLLSLFAPYAVSFINHRRWAPSSKRLVAIVTSLVLALIVIALYYLMTGEPPMDWPYMLVLAVLVTQTSYSLLLKPSATIVEARAGTGSVG